jgi:hypothetical protein
MLQIKVDDAQQSLSVFVAEYQEAKKRMLDASNEQLEEISDDYNVASSKIILLKTRLRITLDEDDRFDLSDLNEGSTPPV